MCRYGNLSTHSQQTAFLCAQHTLPALPLWLKDTHPNTLCYLGNVTEPSVFSAEVSHVLNVKPAAGDGVCSKPF